MSEKTPKYKTLAELTAAYTSGELSRDCKVVLDNDVTFVYVAEECVFRSDPSEMLESALNLLHVPWEYC